MSEEAAGGSRIKSGTTNKRKPPRWTIAFLRALERCGQARASAEAAGVDHTTAYARRRAHAEFAEGWAAALAAFKENKRRAEEADPSTIRSSADGPAVGSDHLGNGPLPAPPQALLGEELAPVNGQLKRVGPGRWSKKKERIFLAELGASGNARRAAKAIGMSTQALSERKAKDARLAQAWDYAVASARSNLHAHAIASGNETFDPRDLPDPDESPLPKVTIREAIDILKLPVPGGAKGQPAVEPYDTEEMTARIAKKMEALGWLEEKEKKGAGWTRDERHNCWVPPGWTQGPDDQATGAED